ncbi:MAG: hypothetical protein K8J31_09575 [Anaerolineae bacterium]|nr:hypothetical protein [Anaerolineae bacterium]
MSTKNPAYQFLESYNPEAVVDLNEFVNAYAHHLLLESNTYKFPIVLDKVFDRYDLSVYELPLPGQRGAVTEDFQILVNSSDRSQVRLYSKAHELVEMLIAAVLAIDPPWLTENQVQELIDKKENWCEIGAAEILMPMQFFSLFIADAPFSLQTAKSVAQGSGLSLIAVIRRMLETGTRSSALVIWRYAHKSKELALSNAGQMTLGREFEPRKKLRVYRVYKSPTLKGHIKKHKSVEMDTTIGIAFQTEGTTLVRGYDYLEIYDDSGFYYTESMPVRYTDEPMVWSLIFFDEQADEQYLISNGVG